MKILFAADGTEHTARAAASLAAFALTLPATPEICVLHFHRPLPAKDTLGHVGQVATERYHRHASAAELAPAGHVLGNAGLSYEAVSLPGDAALGIAAYAAERGFDLVVMGARSADALQGIPADSVSDEVQRTSPCPVMVVR